MHSYIFLDFSALTNLLTNQLEVLLLLVKDGKPVERWRSGWDLTGICSVLWFVNVVKPLRNHSEMHLGVCNAYVFTFNLFCVYVF